MFSDPIFLVEGVVMVKGLLGLGGLLLAGAAWAVDQPSTYPGCAQREVSVAWGGLVEVDLSACQSFGLGTVAQAPAHGQVQPAGDPAQAYVYVHGGQLPAGGGGDRFVVLDDNSDTITVRVEIAAPSTGLALAGPGLPALRAGRATRSALVAEGGQGPWQFRLADGALPAGLALTDEGLLVGTPTTRGPFQATIEVRDDAGDVAQLAVAGDVAPPDVALIPASARVTPGQPFRQPLHARGGVPPYRFALEPGDLPPTGITLGEDGVFEGLTAVPAGDYPVTVRITDASTGPGAHVSTARFTFRVRPGA